MGRDEVVWRSVQGYPVVIKLKTTPSLRTYYHLREMLTSIIVKEEVIHSALKAIQSIAFLLGILSKAS